MAWDRAHYSPGGGDALLHYVVPGANARELVVSRSRHRIESVPVERAQVRGHRIPDGQPVRMEGVPDGLVCRHDGSVDDLEFNNVHIRIAAARERIES